MRALCRSKVKFDMAIGIVIMCNSATIGIQAEVELNEKLAASLGGVGTFIVLEWIYLVVPWVNFVTSRNEFADPWVSTVLRIPTALQDETREL